MVLSKFWEKVMKQFHKIALLLLFLIVSIANANDKNSDVFTHTYSIVARDSGTDDIGVAVQSHWFSVGSVVSWAEAGVGAIATQSLVYVSFGPRGLELLKQGKTASEVLNILFESDNGRDFRQLAIIDKKGNVAAYKGKKIIAYKGLVSGEAILGANLFKDLFASITDVIGGRSGSYERELRKAKDIALEEMKQEAHNLGANAVIAIDLDYETIGSGGGNMLMVSASGTAVIFE
jgi:uncharacterized protein YbjQ (UPF0145 family)